MPHRRTLGTSEYPELVAQVEAFIKDLRRQKRWAVLEAIIARDLTCCEAYRFDVAGVLDAELAKRKQVRDALLAESSDTDLSPLVDVLVEDSKYRKQIRRLIPLGVRFPSSRFTRKAIAAFIRDLHTVNRFNPEAITRPSSPATKNRYRAALSVFAQRLIEEEVIESNPVRYVKPPRQSKTAKQIKFLDLADTKRLLGYLEGPQQALEALMAGTAMEWGACSVLRRKDIDFETRIVRAAGTKTGYRFRYVEVADDFAWEYVRAYAAGLLPNVRLFTMTESKALDTHQAACKALGLTITTLHQHRHGFAVRHLQDKCDEQWLKNQLGHAPHSSLIYTTYGVYRTEIKLTGKHVGRKNAEENARSNTNRNTTPRTDFKRNA